jgi:hypothetical protein
MNRKYLSIMFIALLTISVFGCLGNSETKDAATVDQQQSQYQTAQPAPHFDWSLERQLEIELYEARNERVATHTVWRSDYGMIEGDCPSIGYPLPYDVQLTNPLRVAYSGSGAVIEQAEPNGLFSSKATSATWVRCITKVNGQVMESPVYIEGKVTAYAYPVDVNYTTNRVKPIENVMPSVILKGNSSAPK